jgi:hypothetical protein
MLPGAAVSQQQSKQLTLLPGAAKTTVQSADDVKIAAKTSADVKDTDAGTKAISC